MTTQDDALFFTNAMKNSGRLTSKQADDNDRRKRMTQQRQALSSRIRKQKKSEYLANKRSIGHLTSTPYSPSKGFTSDVMKLYIRNPSVGTLQAVFQSLPATAEKLKAEASKPLLFFSTNEEEIAEKFVVKLGTHAAPYRTQHSLCLNILQKLSAISSTSIFLEEDYYGNSCSWSVLIADEASLVSLVMDNVGKYESCLLVLGNLASDPSSHVCPKLRQAGLVDTLVSCIQQPTAAWALTNAIRHDSSAYASEYCAENLLSASMLESMLQSNSVATQAAWMAASILDREKETVQYLVSHPSFCNTLVSLIQRPNAPNQLVPLLQSLGSIASYEANVPILLGIPSFLPTIVELLQPPLSDREVFQKTVWLAGCLLVDSRLENHPSSIQATPALVPTLFEYMRSELLSSTEKQDVGFALLNAMDVPPSCDLKPNMSYMPFFLPDPPIVKGAILNGIVGLVKSSDADAAVTGVHILRLLLRQEGDFFMETLEEANVQSALEALCNSDVDFETSEVAADILDDFFYLHELEDDVNMAPTRKNDGTLAFGLPDFTMSPSGGEPHLGMGRGRGAVMPSWMTKT
ncbi:unnamed protein product [Cylindrotheca closterium]|uniref:Importin subunit alpha n=1 Tax=Cylindrotheca closterium TaxID=2856 RepID=A0AAD2FKG7_9STRA|nr:unnamed protein product [Cylindrotheca closterium]